MSLRFLIPLGALAALSACGGAPEQAVPTPAATFESEVVPPADNAAPAVEVAGGKPAAFAQCAVCHSVEKGGKAIVGPDLWGVVGSAAGSRPGFTYSDPLKAAGLTWDAATLDKWLTNPAKLVPGTKMAFPGQPDAAKRQAIIDYLTTLK